MSLILHDMLTLMSIDGDFCYTNWVLKAKKTINNLIRNTDTLGMVVEDNIISING